MDDATRHAPAHARDGAYASAPGQLRGRAIVVATDGSPASDAAVAVAAAIVHERGARPHVVRAFDTSGVAIPCGVRSMIAAADALVGPDVHAPEVDDLRAELALRLGHAVDWPIAVGIGTPAGVIVRQASHVGAALVVMGLRRHALVDRVTHDETTLSVMRAAPCPVLGVTPALVALPQCVVAGVDFGAPSLRAARAACGLVATGGTLVLAYVETAGAGDDDLPDDIDGEGVAYARGIDAAFARLAADLGVSHEIVVRQVRVADDGHPVADRLRTVAAAHAAAVIAIGSRRHDWLDRTVLGSVTTELARAGRHALLVVPPPPRSSVRLDT